MLFSSLTKVLSRQSYALFLLLMGRVWKQNRIPLAVYPNLPFLRKVTLPALYSCYFLKYKAPSLTTPVTALPSPSQSCPPQQYQAFYLQDRRLKEALAPSLQIYQPSYIYHPQQPCGLSRKVTPMPYPLCCPLIRPAC